MITGSTSKQRRETSQSSPEEQADAAVISSAELVMSNLDLLKLILARLPVKPVNKFKAVSKEWLGLISDPKFQILHYNSNIASVSGLFIKSCKLCADKPSIQFVPICNDSSLPPKHPLESLFQIEPTLVILSSCNGLLLCGNNLEKRHNHGDIYLCNPSLRQFTRIPCPPGAAFCKETACGTILAFDPQKWPHYKVIFVYRTKNCFKAEVYSSDTRSWKIVEDQFSGTIKLVLSMGVFVNGFIYWPSFDSKSSLCFDVGQECFGPILMPQSLSSEPSPMQIPCIWEYRERSYLVKYGEKQYHVYELDGDRSRWFLRYSVNIYDIVSKVREQIPNLVTPCYPMDKPLLCFSCGETENDGVILLLAVKGRAVKYDIEKKISKVVCDLKTCKHLELWMIVPGLRVVHEHRDTLFHC